MYMTGVSLVGLAFGASDAEANRANAPNRFR